MASEFHAPLDLTQLRSWTFLTNHAQVLLALARDPSAVVAEIAAAAEISERTCYRILGDLQKAGYVRRTKRGRRNAYEIDPSLPLEDPVIADELVETLLALVPEVERHDHVVVA